MGMLLLFAGGWILMHFIWQRFWPRNYYWVQFYWLVFKVKKLVKLGAVSSISAYGEQPFFTAREHLIATLMSIHDINTKEDCRIAGSLENTFERARQLYDIDSALRETSDGQLELQDFSNLTPIVTGSTAVNEEDIEAQIST
ncbi:hypothetical protein DL98DRAFT_515907 [Cadophora sp. DSE1049]|nr:hypothetical protein DL98DRAFT_515907 [Cadophora sp. DSE1049]